MVRLSTSTCRYLFLHDQTLDLIPLLPSKHDSHPHRNLAQNKQPPPPCIIYFSTLLRKPSQHPKRGPFLQGGTDDGERMTGNGRRGLTTDDGRRTTAFSDLPSALSWQRSTLSDWPTAALRLRSETD